MNGLNTAVCECVSWVQALRTRQLMRIWGLRHQAVKSAEGSDNVGKYVLHSEYQCMSAVKSCRTCT